MTIYRIERIDRVRRGEPAFARADGGYSFAPVREAGYAIWLAGFCEVVFVPDSALRDCRRRARPPKSSPASESSRSPSTKEEQGQPASKAVGECRGEVAFAARVR